MAGLELDNHDLSSKTWEKINTFLEESLIKLRLDNDSRLNDCDTAEIRGKIQFCKDMLRAGKDRPDTLPGSVDN
jgi:hypothetical protein